MAEKTTEEWMLFWANIARENSLVYADWLERGVKELEAKDKEIAELKAVPKTIYCAGNKTSSLYFEDKAQAEAFAATGGATAGIEVWSISVLTNKGE